MRARGRFRPVQIPTGQPKPPSAEQGHEPYTSMRSLFAVLLVLGTTRSATFLSSGQSLTPVRFAAGLSSLSGSMGGRNRLQLGLLDHEVEGFVHGRHIQGRRLHKEAAPRGGAGVEPHVLPSRRHHHGGTTTAMAGWRWASTHPVRESRASERSVGEEDRAWTIIRHRAWTMSP